MINQNRIKIDQIHPNTGNAEAFLNSWEESFVQEEVGKNRFVFCSTISQTKIALLFFDSYAEADAFGATYFNPVNEKRMWSINGAMLFVVSGDKEDKIQSLISHFSGRE